MNLVSAFSGSAVNPITLSGKHASISRIAVSAMFAAIVMHRVPLGQSLLCCRPASMFECSLSDIALPFLRHPFERMDMGRHRGVPRPAVYGEIVHVIQCQVRQVSVLASSYY